MSSVFVQIGQGGNQLGETFFNTVLRPEDIKRNRRWCVIYYFYVYFIFHINLVVAMTSNGVFYMEDHKHYNHIKPLSNF